MAKNQKRTYGAVGVTCISCKRELPLTEEFYYRRSDHRHSFYSRCIECSRAHNRANYAAKPVKPYHTLSDENKQRRATWGKRYRQKLRERVITQYGARCACCGETTLEFLTIDHVENNGGKERRERKLRDAVFFNHIIRLNFPSQYQVLCYNCNCSKAHTGVCPHQLQQSQAKEDDANLYTRSQS